MSGAVSYRALMRGQTPDGTWHDAGSVFTTDAPEGVWMQPLDEKGQPIPKAEKPPAGKKAFDQNAIDDARREVADAAQKHIDGLVEDHGKKLKAETDRADDAEKARDDARAQVEKLEGELSKALSDGDALRAKIAAFDHDGDGQPGGSAKTTAKK